MKTRGIVAKESGIAFCVMDWKTNKNPALVVWVERPDGGADSFKVATFDSKADADWFCEVVEEVASSLRKEEEDECNDQRHGDAAELL